MLTTAVVINFENKHNISQSLSCFRTDNQSKFTFGVIVKNCGKVILWYNAHIIIV